MKTAKIIEESKAASDKSPSESPKESGLERRMKNLVAPWPKGVSGNPGGKPKKDLAAEIAEAIFSENKEEIYRRMAKGLFKGNAYVFDVLAQRAFGKLKETKEFRHVYEETPDADLNKRIAELERELGLAGAIDEAGRVGIAQARAEAPNGHAKDSDVLSR